MAIHKQVLIVAGEASGDALGASLLRALQSLVPGLRARGMGGARLRDMEMETVVDLDAVNVMGGVEVGRHMGRVLRAYRTLCADVRLGQPDVAVLIDYPEFNLKFAEVLKRLEIPVVYYVSPQVWAWRRGRVARIARLVDHILVLFPFEVGIYERAGVPVTWVGHPALEGLPSRESPPAGASRGARVALLPGSRPAEVSALLPVMLEAAECLQDRGADVSFVVARAPTVPRTEVDRLVGAGRARVAVSEEGAPAVLAHSDAALVASGTATLQAAALEVPMVVLYRTAWTTYLAGRALVSPLPGIAMVNILAGKRVVPETVQRLRPGLIASRLEAFLTQPRHAARTREALRRVASGLEAGGASRNAASVVASFLAESSPRRSGSAAHPTVPPRGARPGDNGAILPASTGLEQRHQQQRTQA